MTYVYFNPNALKYKLRWRFKSSGISLCEVGR